MAGDLRLQDAAKLRFCIRDAGSGPAVVLLHGTSANLGVWDEVVRLLGGGVRTIAVDQRGHGRSDKPPTGYGAHEYSADVAELIRALRLTPALVVGHSLGARNAIVLASRYPQLVAGVVAVDYTPFIEKEVLDALQLRVAGGLRTFPTEGALLQYLRRRYPRITEDAVIRRARYGYRRSDSGYEPLAAPAAMAETVEGLRRDFNDEARTVAVPVTILRGQMSQIVTGAALGRTQLLRPDFRVVEIPDTDHYIPEERPDLVANEIRYMLGIVKAPGTYPKPL